MNDVRQSFLDFYTRIKEASPEIAIGLLVLVLFIFSGLFVSRGIKKMMPVTKTSGKKAQLIRRLVRWTFYAFGAAFALQIMGLTQAASGILAAGGILTVVLGFAFREIGENLLAGLFMTFSRSFEVGDLVESNNIRGTVKQINIRDIHVRTADGIDIFIPSATIYKNPLLNFTRDGLRRTSFNIGIDYRNDAEKARELILQAITNVPGVLPQPAPDVNISNFQQNYLEFEIHIWINTFSELNNLSAIRTKCMDSVRNNLINNGFTLSSEITTSVEVAQKN